MYYLFKLKSGNVYQLRIRDGQGGGSEPALKLKKKILLMAAVLIYYKPKNPIGAGLRHVQYFLI